MNILCLQLKNRPEQPPDLVSQISSYPGILLDGPVSVHTLSPLSVKHAIQVIETNRPDLLVLHGSPTLTQAWKTCLELAYPKLLMMETIAADWNQILDTLNQKIAVIRRKRVKSYSGKWEIEPCDPNYLFEDLMPDQQKTARALGDRFIKTYHLQDILEKLSTSVCERIFYCLDLLEQHLDDISLPAITPLEVLDVGIKEWSYVPALSCYFKKRVSLVQLKGIELDPYFYDRNGLTRMDQARYFASLCQASVQEADWLNYSQSVHVICHFLPVILPENALRWRIPLQYHQPQKGFAHTYQLLAPNGIALIYNGVLLEYQRTLQLIDQLGYSPIKTSPHLCRFRGKECGFVTVLQKKG